MPMWNKEHKSTNQAGIPKIVMQTWKTREVPEDWLPSQVSIDKHMSNWSYVLMTDEDNRNFVEQHFPDFLPYYDQLPWAIQRADAVRYCWLYVHGGVYMDLDYEILEPLDILFSTGGDLYLAASSNIPSSLTNSFMASRPRHQFWLDVIEAIKCECDNPTWWAMGKHLRVMMSTGPGIVNRVARSGKHIYTVIPPDLLSPENLCQATGKVGMMRPLRGCSWGSWDTQLYNFCFCDPWLAVVVLCVIVLVTVLIIWYLIVYLRRRHRTVTMVV